MLGLARSELVLGISSPFDEYLGKFIKIESETKDNGSVKIKFFFFASLFRCITKEPVGPRDLYDPGERRSGLCFHAQIESTAETLIRNLWFCVSISQEIKGFFYVSKIIGIFLPKFQ